jgi:hypothetical protein
MARVGLDRLEYLVERLDRAIDMEGSDVTVNTLTSDLGVTVTAGGADLLEGTLKLSNGGAVVQDTNKGTAVTLAKPTGKITMQATALADATTVSFTVNCTGFGRATDVCIVNHHSIGTAGNYVVQAHGHATNSFVISVRNISGGSLSDAIILHYALIQTAHT